MYQLFTQIFEKEHFFTIKELNKIAQQKQVSPRDFNISEHYKLNSHIFKSNLTIISTILIEDIWLKFNAETDSQYGPLN